jgi:hypothetical protein
MDPGSAAHHFTLRRVRGTPREMQIVQFAAPRLGEFARKARGTSIVARKSASDTRVRRSLHSASLHAGYERVAAIGIKIDAARSS